VSTAASSKTLEAIPLSETCQKNLPPIPATVAGLLYHGHTICAGPPKLGKSYLALQLAHAVASGEPALGALTVERPGRVLYLALEDGERRLKVRTDALLAGAQPGWLDRIDVVYELPDPLDTDEGMEQLEATLAAGSYELLIVDTYVAAFPSETASRDLFKGEYKQMAELTKLARLHDLAVLTIAHTRKGDRDEDGSSITAVAGTGGRTAAADAILMLAGTSGQPKATLTVVSRDTEGLELELTRDASTTGWRATTPVACGARARRPNANHARILELLAQQGPLSRGRIDDALPDVNQSSLGTWLKRLMDSGEIVRVGLDRYGLPDHQPGEPAAA
jgi:AAA domain